MTRYYTVNFLDMFGNATNIGARTFGTGAGRFLIATTEWEGEVPEGATLFRVTNPLMWILMRVLVNDENDFAEAHRLQNQFSIRPINPPPAADPANWPDGNDESAVGFMRILDTVLRNTGWPEGEDALVGRFRGLGITGPRSVGEMIEDSQIRAGIEKGFAEAQAVIRGAMAQNGQPVGAWSEPLDIGRYGYNYLYRSSVNTLGTGANVTDENYPFTSFVDGDGEPLDGSKGVYELRLDPPPPARFFWSVTMYDQRTRELVPNSAGKYLVSDRTPELVRGPDGSVTIRMQKEPVTGEGAANWLPAPDGPFYLAIRAQGPEAPMLERTWRPPDVRRVGPAGE